MKRISAFILGLLIPALAVAATLSPVQLLNPSGSTAGQAIISNGASSAPTWQAVPLTGIATQAANTVLGNGTASTAAPTALSVPSCSAATNALLWTSGAGFSCNSGINAATLGGATFASPGAIGGTTAGSGAFTTITASSTITPSQTAGIVGTTTNNNANAGSVGEYQTATTTNTALTNGAGANLTSVSLTAGDWDVQCDAFFHPAVGTTITGLAASVSTTSASLGAFGATTYLQLSFNTGSNNYIMSPVSRLALASTTTVYCVGVAAFGTSTMQGDGFIRARRVR